MTCLGREIVGTTRLWVRHRFFSYCCGGIAFAPLSGDVRRLFGRLPGARLVEAMSSRAFDTSTLRGAFSSGLSRAREACLPDDWLGWNAEGSMRSCLIVELSYSFFCFHLSTRYHLLVPRQSVLIRSHTFLLAPTEVQLQPGEPRYAFANCGVFNSPALQNVGQFRQVINSQHAKPPEWLGSKRGPRKAQDCSQLGPQCRIAAEWGMSLNPEDQVRAARPSSPVAQRRAW